MVTAHVAAADSRTLYGVYIWQIIATRYDSQAVNIDRRTIFVGNPLLKASDAAILINNNTEGD